MSSFMLAGLTNIYYSQNTQTVPTLAWTLAKRKLFDPQTWAYISRLDQLVCTKRDSRKLLYKNFISALACIYTYTECLKHLYNADTDAKLCICSYLSSHSRSDQLILEVWRFGNSCQSTTSIVTPLAMTAHDQRCHQIEEKCFLNHDFKCQTLN